MTLFRGKYRVETTRLPHWDYSTPGYYFVTVCTHDRGYLFGDIRDGKMRLNEFGEIVSDCWRNLSGHYRNLIADEFVIMPNHIHAIIRLVKIVHVNTRCGDIVTVETPVETGLKPVSTNATNATNVVHTPDTTPTHSSLSQSLHSNDMAFPTRPAKCADSNNQEPKAHGLSDIVGGLKTFSARQINLMRKTTGNAVWQPRFHDRIVRDDHALFVIRRYIRNNPKNWGFDRNNPLRAPER
jgi:putative transposase